MNARDMFEELGYRCIKSNNSIWYVNDSDEENYRSVEFYFCDCTFDAIGNYGDPLMVNVKELEAINKQCEEIGWLEEEKQEIKQETNFEHYKDEIIENCSWSLALVDGKPHECNGVNCNDCGFSTGYGCSEKIKEWLRKPYEKPKYKLTQFEYDLLQLYKGKYSFKLSNSLRGMKEKGYFRSVDENAKIEDILESCEVIK